MDDVFRALADASRRQLLDRLHARNGQTLNELCEGLAMTRQAVTKHLHVLEGAGLVEGRRKGRERLWRLKTERVDEARAWLDEISRQWDVRLERLRALVDAPEQDER